MFQTMYELLRYISHVPILLPHATMEDTTLGGYTIPKDTQVIGLPVFISCVDFSMFCSSQVQFLKEQLINLTFEKIELKIVKLISEGQQF